jgi:5-methylcytosine-specific restriction endonuclease McrA
MKAYAARELGLKDHEAYRRIEAARRGREFPVIFEALDDGRLHLTAVVLLAPHLSLANGAALIAECFGKSKSEIELVLAKHFPQPDVPTLLTAVPAAIPVQPQVVANTQSHSLRSESPEAFASVYTGTVPMTRPAYPRVTPLAPQRFALQVTIQQDTHDLLRRAQELLAHALPSRDMDRVLNRALIELVRKLESRKFGASSRARANSPRRGGRPDERRIPAAVRRAVAQRDGGRCTFVGANGHRCEARARLEFDHVTPIARGGLTTAANLRLRCRAHNQHEAEQAFGAAFMRGRRERASTAPPGH